MIVDLTIAQEVSSMSKIYADMTLTGTKNIGHGAGNGYGSSNGSGTGSGTVSTGGRISNDCVGVGYGIHDDIRSIGSLIMNGFHGSGRGHSNGYGIDYGCEGGFGNSSTFLIEDPDNWR